MSEQEYYPPPGFRFTVTVVGSAAALAALSGADASFQEVSGIQSEFASEEVIEGGENRFAHQLPRHGKYSNLVLKRGVVTGDSFLNEWCGQTIGSRLSTPIIPQNLVVTLLNENGNPLIVWGFVNTYPIKWDISTMNSMDNAILTETMEFSYNYFERLNLGGGATAAVKLAQFVAGLT